MSGNAPTTGDNHSKDTDNFGSEHKITPRLTSIGASISAIRRNSQGKFVVSLDNGQVWAVTEPARLGWRMGDPVEITRGVFNSFFLQKEGGKRRVRAKRVKYRLPRVPNH